MNDATGYALALLALLAIKHVIADFVLQSRYILENRRFYGHPAGLLHVAIHGASSALVISILGFPAVTSLLVVLAGEALIHYHVDWAKDNIVSKLGLGPDNRVFWYITGTDQGLHQLTYVAMTAYLVSVTVI